MKGGNARKRSVASWQTDQIVWWRGEAYDRQSRDYQHLLRRAYQALFDQNERFRAALMATRGITLIHTSGETNLYKTILTRHEFCHLLMEIRDDYDKCDKHIVHKRRKLAKQMTDDPTRMSKEEFFARVDEAKKGPTHSMLPGEDLTAFLRRMGYDL